MKPVEGRRILGLDRDAALWVLAIVALVLAGILLDMLWGSL